MAEGSVSNLAPDDLELLELARLAARRAHAPYSRYSVGSAIRCEGDGRVFVGCNVENASYGLSLCAERTAAASAVAAGRRDLARLLVYAEGPELPFPCGACRQFLIEFNELLVVIVSNGERQRTLLLKELLPHSFGGSCLPKTAITDSEPGKRDY